MRPECARKVKHFCCRAHASVRARDAARVRMRVFVVVIVALALAAGACGEGARFAKMENVRPPKPGVPMRPADIVGIYRTIHQSVLQLHHEGTLELTTPSGGAVTGTFALSDGAFEVATSSCGQQLGRYKVVVTGRQSAGQARLDFTLVDDSCAGRPSALTRDPWVYANS
jgi:hypothetical protein